MATYSVPGYRFFSENGKENTSFAPAEIEIVSPAGTGKLDFRYLSSNPENASVTLSDYNILIDGSHLNDGQLPDRLELYGVSWEAEGETQSASVFGLVYEDQNGITDFSFPLAEGSLPELRTSDDFVDFIAASKAYRLGDEGEVISINLPEIPGVKVTGIIQSLIDLEAETANSADMFDFDGADSSGMPAGDEFEIIEDAMRDGGSKGDLRSDPVEPDTLIDENADSPTEHWSDLG